MPWTAPRSFTGSADHGQLPNGPASPKVDCLLQSLVCRNAGHSQHASEAPQPAAKGSKGKSSELQEEVDKLLASFQRA